MVNSSLTLVSRFMGFLRDLAISYRMGASATPAADAFYTALAFPNLFRRIFGEGAFAAAFQPAYVRALDQEGKEEADKLAEEAMAGLAAMTIALTIVCQLAMPWLMILINPGYVARPGQVQAGGGADPDHHALPAVHGDLRPPVRRAEFARPLHRVGHRPGPAQRDHAGLRPAAGGRHAARPGGLRPGWSPPASPRWACCGGACSKSGSHVRWVWPTLTPEIRALIAKAVPGALSASAFQVNIFISGILASQVTGARSWLNAADRLYQLPVGLVGVAIGVALLPRLSRAVHTGDEADASGAMDEAITFAMALTLPAAAAMLAMPFFMIDGLFTRGQFLPYDAHATGAVLFQYGWGAPAFVLMQIVNRAFYARQDTKTPMRVAMIQVAVNVGLGLLLFRLIGAPGIAAATSAASWLSVVQMAVILKRRGHYALSPRAVSRLIRVLAASALLGIILALASHWLQGHAMRRLHLGPIHYKEVALAALAALALPLYGALLFASGGVTPGELKGALKRSNRR